MSEITKPSQSPSGLLTLMRLTSPKYGLLGLAIGTSIFSSLAGLAIPLFLQQMIDRAFKGVTFFEGAIVVGVFVGQALLTGVTIYLLSYVGQHTVKTLREKIASQSIHFPLAYFQIERPGELVSRTLNDTGLVQHFVGFSIPSFITGIVTLIFSVFILFYMDWKMSIIILFAIPIVAVVIVPLGRMMYQISKKTQDATADFTANYGQLLASAGLIKASNGEKQAEAESQAGIARLFRYGKKESMITAILNPVITLIVMGIVMGIVAYGGYRVANGTLSTGTFIAFIMYMFQVINPIVSFGTFFSDMQKVKGATERLLGLMEEPIEELHKGERVELNGQELIFQDVSFNYNDERELLKNLNFTAKANQTIAFVGPSGSGKSTIFNLIERFYTPTNGKIVVGNQDLNELSLYSWRQQIGYVQQESVLLAGTVRENLSYGLDFVPTDKDLARVIELACATEVIAKLPAGFDSPVGERGSLLSGGERQRIAIARAFLRNPKILLLDEATASLDSQSEAIVQKALKNLMVGRTTFIIAHRLATVVGADQLIFVENGEITGQGTHQELLKNHQLYYEFSTQQLTT